MTKTEYLNKRNMLLDKAQGAINSNNLADYEKLKAEIEQLDTDFENQATAQANLNALSNSTNTIPEIYSKGETKTMNDFLETKEYRNAFMNYVVKGTKIPKEFTNEVTTTSDVGVMIPTTVLNRIVEKIESIGMLLPLVTRTSYKGGVAIPKSDVKPVASWVAEGATSAVQKNGVNGTVTFAYHKLRCAVSMTLEVETMALSAFESKFVNDVANAMVKALEQAIVSGDGNGKPKGILAETPADGQALEINTDESLDFSLLVKMESALPTAYEGGAKYFMTKKTFMEFYGMTDNNGQPIARVNFGINNKVERVLLGRSVVLLDEYMSNYSANIAEDTVVAFLFNPADYILNTNLNVTVKTYEDNDTEDKITKAVMLVDGKVVDKNSLVTLTVTPA